jgi:uncharacterized protein GlcG (DUF336 family)
MSKKSIKSITYEISSGVLTRLSGLSARPLLLGLSLLALLPQGPGVALAQSTAGTAEPTYSVRLLTPETALKAAQVALQRCRDQGYQVAVAVVDRAGTPQVMLRDRFAGAHTPDTAIRKAWTAVSFRTSTTDLANETQAGKLQSGIRQMARVAAIGGGWMIEAAGSILGGIGVSGAPGAAADDDCAKAGMAAIRDALDF